LDQNQVLERFYLHQLLNKHVQLLNIRFDRLLVFSIITILLASTHLDFFECNDGSKTVYSLHENEEARNSVNDDVTCCWMEFHGGDDGESVRGMDVDSNGNVYVAGKFGESTIFGINITGNGDYDSYIVKHDDSGNLEWVRTFGGGDWDDIRDLKVDSQNNIIILGKNSDNFTSDDDVILQDAGYYIAKINSSGELVWTLPVNFGGGHDDYGDEDGQDHHDNHTDNGHDNETHDSHGDHDDHGGHDDHDDHGDGHVDKAPCDDHGDGHVDHDERALFGDLRGITINSAGEIIVYGHGKCHVIFGSTSTPLGTDYYAPIVAKLSTNGDLLWSKTIVSIEDNNSVARVYAESVMVDSNQDIIISGAFRGRITFDSSIEPLQSTLNGSNGNQLFYSKLSSEGDWLWAKHIDAEGWSSKLELGIDGGMYLFASISSDIIYPCSSGQDENDVHTLFYQFDQNGDMTGQKLDIDWFDLCDFHITSTAAGIDGRIHLSGEIGGVTSLATINSDLTLDHITGFPHSENMNIVEIEIDSSGVIIASGDFMGALIHGDVKHYSNGSRDVFVMTFSDQDKDGIDDSTDKCNDESIVWQSNLTTDFDFDGCRDDYEDDDDDNDGIIDSSDLCRLTMSQWAGNNVTRNYHTIFYQQDYDKTDRDNDGCLDNFEDEDDDNDGVQDNYDSCKTGEIGWTSGPNTDNDADGCFDLNEDNDDDNDGLNDENDSCPSGETEWWPNSENDHDSDGCLDYSEDNDDDNDSVLDNQDNCSRGILSWIQNSTTDFDLDGCHDLFEDDDDDNDGFDDANDSFPLNSSEWNDFDGDLFGDNIDDCIGNYGTSTVDRLGCIDQDEDGVSDLNDFYPYDSSRTVETSEDVEENENTASGESDSSLAYIVPLAAATFIFVGFIVFKRFTGTPRDSEPIDNEENDSDETENYYHQSEDLPSEDLSGEIGEDGYEVIEYPNGSGKWWWRDPGSSDWNEWVK